MVYLAATLVIAMALMTLWLQATQADRILVFVPFPMTSHQNAFQPTVRELAERGHHVTYLTAIPMEKPLPSTLKQVIVPNRIDAVKNALPGFVAFGESSIPWMSTYYARSIHAVMEATLSSSEAQKVIHSDERFDLVIHEALCSEPVVALQHKFKAPGVAFMPMIDSFWTHEISGLTANPAYMVDFKTDFTGELSFYQRLLNFYTLVSTLAVSYTYLYFHQRLMDKYFNYTGWEERPTIGQLLGDQALILVNSHHALGYNFPKAPHMKEVGGLNLQTPKPLPKKLEQLLNGSNEGVIYFSFGTNINLAEDSSKDVYNAFVSAFKKLKQRVLWKWKGKAPSSLPSNIHLSEWFPQQDILVHKNVKLFITHGGLSSVLEAVNSAVPVVGIPFFGDQKRNINRVVDAGLGVLLSLGNLTESSIYWAVNEVLNDERYKQQALRTQRIFQDRPMKPVEESVYWIEYVLKHGNILRPASTQMPLYQLLLLDVLGAIAAGIALVVFISKKLFGHITSYLHREETPKFKRT